MSLPNYSTATGTGTAPAAGRDGVSPTALGARALSPPVSVFSSRQRRYGTPASTCTSYALATRSIAGALAMAARITVKVRFAGSPEGSPWTNLRVNEAELSLPSLKALLAKALQCTPAALAYLQYQDGDGDWLTVCNDADILDGVDELGGNVLRLQVLWRGARDAFQQERTPPLTDRSPADVSPLAPRYAETELAVLVERGDIEVTNVYRSMTFRP